MNGTQLFYILQRDTYENFNQRLLCHEYACPKLALCSAPAHQTLARKLTSLFNNKQTKRQLIIVTAECYCAIIGVWTKQQHFTFDNIYSALQTVAEIH